MSIAVLSSGRLNVLMGFCVAATDRLPTALLHGHFLDCLTPDGEPPFGPCHCSCYGCAFISVCFRAFLKRVP